MKLLLRVSYLGTRYCGFQVQKNGLAIQQVLQDAAEQVWGERFPLTGCSRTDAGVHAKDFACTLEGGQALGRIPLDALPAVLNRYLPDDVAVQTATAVADSFHPRYDVAYKEYKYYILNRPSRSPFDADRAWHYPHPLKVEEMNQAAARIIGKHDFSAFMSSGSSVTDTVRTVIDCRVTEDDLGHVIVTVSADGFLYNMVRIIVGTLVDVSRGRIAPEQIEQIIASGDRSKAGSTAPACGLYLNRVVYPPEALSER